MEAILICGSPRKGGNTEVLLQRCADNFEMNGIKSELVLLAEKKLKPCVACLWCKNNKKSECAIKDDDFEEILKKIIESQIIILGSPVYFGSATAQIKMLIDRAGYVSRAVSANPLSGKIGAPIVVARRAGHNFTYAQLSFWYTINDMIVPGANYWNIAFGGQKGEVNSDEQALQTIDKFCSNTAALAKIIFPNN